MITRQPAGSIEEAEKRVLNEAVRLVTATQSVYEAWLSPLVNAVYYQRDTAPEVRNANVIREAVALINGAMGALWMFEALRIEVQQLQRLRGRAKTNGA